MKYSVRELLSQGRGVLKGTGTETGGLDALLILGYALGIKKERVLSAAEIELDGKTYALYEKYLRMRARGCPVQYIIKKCEFYSLEFYVDGHVLIPRPETELLVETAIRAVGKKSVSIAEIGTGSGCVAVSVARNCINARIFAVDICPEALRIAKKNALDNEAAGQIEFILGDMFGAYKDSRKFDVIVSNPPYIKTADIGSLARSVRDYEPLAAIDGGKDGLDMYRRIAAEGFGRLLPGGGVFLEIGYDQAESVKKIFEENNYNFIEIKKDLAGFDRVIRCVKGNTDV